MTFSLRLGSSLRAVSVVADLARKLTLTIGALILGSVLAAGQARAQDEVTKIALVIGMGDYVSVPKLENTLNDARGIAETLEGAGFRVTLALDTPLVPLLDIIEEFRFRSETADLALVYFAGHGVEVAGENFLIPVDAQVTSNLDVQRQSISLDQLEAAVDRARVMRVVILDSCRDNPLGGEIDLDLAAADAGDSDAATRSAGRMGLAPVDPDRGSVVAFAARDGQVALDGIGNNSPYAAALMEKMAEPGLEISLMFRQVRDLVLNQTGNLQEPHIYGSLGSNPFYIAGPREGEIDVSAIVDPIEAWANVPVDQMAVIEAEAATAEDSRSLIALAKVHMNPRGEKYDLDRARALYEQAAALGDPQAEFELGRMYEMGFGVDPDPARALALFQSSADKGYARAINDLGFMYFQGGLGLARDPEAGIELWEEAAALRHPQALFNLASLINEGVIQDKGPEDAAAYLYDALRTGSQDVMDQLMNDPTNFSLETRVALQAKLSSVALYDGPADGDFGPGTQSALRQAFGIEG
jgi:TPR repeat protein